jgi:hypothetical protein
LGRDKLIECFGPEFHFHDAEILELRSRTKDSSFLTVHAWTLTNRTDEAGFYVRHRESVVTFEFDEVVDIDLEGFSSQNVIARLEIEESADTVRVVLAPCYGLSGTIESKRLSIELSPIESGESSV